MFGRYLVSTRPHEKILNSMPSNNILAIIIFTFYMYTYTDSFAKCQQIVQLWFCLMSTILHSFTSSILYLIILTGHGHHINRSWKKSSFSLVSIEHPGSLSHHINRFWKKSFLFLDSIGHPGSLSHHINRFLDSIALLESLNPSLHFALENPRQGQRRDPDF